MDYIPMDELKLISQKDTYPKGANSPTLVTTYRCPCGWGRIVIRDVRGFDDCTIQLECLLCLRKYHPYMDRIGDEFVLDPK